jgi:uncharacterized protein YecE (DUF72 family)
MNIRIGTSGWRYAHWRGGVFYPQGLRQKDEFACYAAHFDTVEINGSFYRVPTEGSVAAWRTAAPAGFSYAWKYPRWLTHYYRLRDPADSFERVFSRMQLGAADGPVLFQLPPQLKADRERLAQALDLLPKGRRAAFEFRHASWYDPAIFRLLGDHDAALCLSDHADAPAPWEITASWTYVRAHGSGGRYWGSYSAAALRGLARRLAAAARDGDVFCFFDNDPEGAAPKDALRLRAMLEDAGAPKRRQSAEKVSQAVGSPA